MEFENVNLNAAMISQPENTGPTSRVYEGATRSTVGGDVESATVTRYSSLDEQAGATSILATARNNAGSPTSLRSDSVTVEIEPGVRTSLPAALKLGYLTKNEAGEYVEANQQDATKAQQEATQDTLGGVEYFEPAQEQAFSDATAAIPSQLLDAAMVRAANQVATTGSISDLSAHLAATTGIPVEQLKHAQGVGQAAFQAQADKAIQALGVNPQDFYQWAKENHQEKLGKAIRLQVTGRSVAGYRELANEYLNNVAPSTEVLNRNNYETKPGPKGEGDLVKVQGMWMSVKTATRAGFI